MEENLATSENTENVKGSDCTLKTELDDAEALMSPLFVPTESEPDFQEILEDSIVDENLKATKNTYTKDLVCDKFKKKTKITEAEASIASSFVPIKAESDFKKISGENVVEDTQASRMMEIGASWATFLVKEEPIDYEETWQNNVKLEPKSPLSMNTQSDGSYKCSKDGVNVKIEDNVWDEELSEELISLCSTKGHIEDIVKEEALSEKLTSPCSIKEEEHNISKESNWHPHLDCSSFPCSSQPVSFTQSLSEMDRRDTEKNFGRCSYSSAETVWFPSFDCQRVLPAASCSKDDHIKGQEKAADTYLWKKQIEPQVAGEKQKQQSGQFGDRISTNLDETHSQRGMLRFGSLQSSTGGECFKCSHCDKHFKRKWDLIRHVRILSGHWIYKCSQCGEAFKQNRQLTQHVRTHTGDLPYKCVQCGKIFVQSGHLTIHMRTHTGDRPYICSQCGKSFVQSVNLTSHMRTHTGERPYKCSQCGAAFTESSSLTVHMRKHTGNRPYKCSHCGKSFVQGSHLTSHMRTHTGDRPYKCSQCGVSFTGSSNLTRHMRKHAGDRPYRCSQCGVSFTDCSHLTRHMRKHIGDQPYKCS